eukprot:6447761-Karenia_brevis.AAC.1
MAPDFMLLRFLRSDEFNTAYCRWLRAPIGGSNWFDVSKPTATAPTTTAPRLPQDAPIEGSK